MGATLSITSDLVSTNETIVADFIVHICSGSMFSGHLNHFWEDNDFIIYCIEKLYCYTFMYISDNWGTENWLNYCVCTPAIYAPVFHFKIRYELCFSDHVPTEFKLDTTIIFEASFLHSSNY